jgi:hypothetical protein
MSTQKQIDANRENSQKSTGSTSTDGLKRSSLNSTVHGFTGQTLVLSDAEKVPYEAFVQQMRVEFRPCAAESRELLQNYTDLRWSIQQITVQQNSILPNTTSTPTTSPAWTPPSNPTPAASRR